MSERKPGKWKREKSILSNKAPFLKRRRLLVTPQQFAYNSNEGSMFLTDDKEVVSPISTESFKKNSENKTELDGEKGPGQAQEPWEHSPRKCATKNKMYIKSSPLHESDIKSQRKHESDDIEQKVIKKEEMKHEDWDEDIIEESKVKEQVKTYTQDISECQTEKLIVLPGNMARNTEADVTTHTTDETDQNREEKLNNSIFDENSGWQGSQCVEENKGRNLWEKEWWTSLQLDSDSSTSRNTVENKEEIRNSSKADGKEDLDAFRLEDDSKIELSTSTDSEYDLLCPIADDVVTSDVWRFADQKSSRVKNAYTNLAKNLSSNRGLDIAIWNYLKCYNRMEKVASRAVYGLIPVLSYCSKDDLSELRKVIQTETDERIGSLRPTMDLTGKQQSKTAFKESYSVIEDGTLSSNYSNQKKAKSSVHSLITDRSYSLSRENREKTLKTLYPNRKRSLYLKDESDESVKPLNPITLRSLLTWSSQDADVWTLDFTTKRFRELIDDWHRLLKNPTFRKVSERFVYEVLTHTMSYWKSAVIEERINDMRTLILAGWPIEFPLNISLDEERWYHLPKLEERIFKYPALLTACSYGLKTSVEELLKLGASIDKYNKFSGEDPLTHACKYGHLEVVKLMLKWKADPNAAIDCCTNRLTTVPITIELVTNIDINNRSKILEELIYHGAATYSTDVDDACRFLDCLRSSYSHSLIKVCAVFDDMKILEPGLIRRFEFIQKQLFRYASILADTIILFLDPRSCPEWMQVALENDNLS